MKKHRTALRFLAIFLALCLTINFAAPFGSLNKAEAGEPVYSAAGMAGKAVDFINQQHSAGEKIDGYTACALSMAGEDLTAAKWTGGKTLKSEIQYLVDLLGDGNSLITYLCSTQNNDGSFGPYANEYGAKAPLQALAAVKGDLAAGSADYSRVQNAVTKSVNFFKDRYQNGSITYAVNGMSFDYRCAEALAGAGENLSVGGWVYQGASLKDTVIASAHSSAADPSVIDAVYLAKELAALYAVDPVSADAGVLAGAIASKQAADGSFGGSIYDQAMVLTALGKTGRISGIDQIKAFNYTNGLKRTHKNSWGLDAGAAWGSDWTDGFEESDTTAQVITALSYLTDADNPASEVYRAIQDGLTYLADIQDADTAGIPAQWDSTFSTAETLLALKAAGKTYDDYAGAASGWVKKSRTKTVAQCLMALNQWNDSARRDRLADLLAGRQKYSDPGTGSFENSVYSDMWAYIALGEASKLGLLNTDNARAYILSKQGADGSWGESFGSYYPDVMSTTQAIRALSHLPGADADLQAQEATTKGLAYLKGLQQADGGVYSAWDDPAVDNSQLIVTLHSLGKDPAAADWENSGGLTPVDYLLNQTMNADYSFGSSKNVLSATEALYALLMTGGQGNPGGGGQTPEEKDSYSVSIAVVGKDGELLLGPGSVVVSKTGQWGLTALGALHATGLPYSESGGFVSSIAGQANSGMNGWMYSVNGSPPAVAAPDKTVGEGDRVIWWYSKDMNSSGPSWDDLLNGGIGDIVVEQPSEVVPDDLSELNKVLPASLQLSEEALQALVNIIQLIVQEDMEVNPAIFAAEHSPVTVVGSLQQPDQAAYAALKNSLDQNVVDLIQKVAADKGAIITDGQAEVALIIPAGALSRDTDITVREPAAGDSRDSGQFPAAPGGFRQLSSIIDLGPDGTEFAEPVTLILQVAIPPLIKPEKLVLAWYDSSSGQWVAIPAVVDAGRGLIMARVRHFSQYAVLAWEPVKSFADVTKDNCGWAQKSIELLAGAGFVSGVDGARFEPDRPVTRAEFASLLVRALGIQAGEGAANPFKDVQAGHWYAGAVKSAYGAGLFKGFSDGTFRPDSAITREEVATALAQAMKLQSPDKKMTFTDTDRIADWARAGVAASVDRGLIQGFPDGAFRPNDTASRAQCAVMVQRMLAGYWGGE